MSFTMLSFQGGAPLQRPPLTQDVIVIDEFWPDPFELRREALRGDFESRSSTSGFFFHDWLASRRHTLRGAELVARVVGLHVLDGHFESRFVYETEADEAATRRKIWVHYDRWPRVGVLHLAPHGPASAGTGFYRHRPTGFNRVEQADRAGNRRQIQEDSTKPEAWELVRQVPARFNRLVLFDSRLFHQAMHYYGHTTEDARLYNIVAFDPTPSQELDHETSAPEQPR